MIEKLCKLIRCLIDLVRYTTAGILLILMLPLSFCVYTLVGIVGCLKASYHQCYLLMYELLKLVLGIKDKPKLDEPKPAETKKEEKEEESE